MNTSAPMFRFPWHVQVVMTGLICYWTIGMTCFSMLLHSKENAIDYVTTEVSIVFAGFRLASWIALAFFHQRARGEATYHE